MLTTILLGYVTPCLICQLIFWKTNFIQERDTESFWITLTPILNILMAVLMPGVVFFSRINNIIDKKIKEFNESS